MKNSIGEKIIHNMATFMSSPGGDEYVNLLTTFHAGLEIGLRFPEYTMALINTLDSKKKESARLLVTEFIEQNPVEVGTNGDYRE